MDTKQRCQSCGMPLGEFIGPDGKAVSNYGTMADSTSSAEYCEFCFQSGSFTQPELTMDDMIELSIKNMTVDLGFTLEKAEEMAAAVIPQLKRWQR